MTPRRAKTIGGIVGVALAIGFIGWRALEPPACSGAVFVELHPPLAAPGPYRFTLTRDGGAPCSFDVHLPPPGPIDTRACGIALDLAVRGEGSAMTITALTLGASPVAIQLRVERGAEVLYDAELKPEYAALAARRQDDRRFCGQRAHVVPECRRGSSQCLPFRPGCRGAADCHDGQVCCVNPAAGLEYGTAAAARCTSASECEASFGAIACRGPADCPGHRACDDARYGADFAPPLTACRP